MSACNSASFPVASTVGTLPADKSHLIPKVAMCVARGILTWVLCKYQGKDECVVLLYLSVSRPYTVSPLHGTPQRCGWPEGHKLSEKFARLDPNIIQPLIRNWNTSHSLAFPGFCQNRAKPEPQFPELGSLTDVLGWSSPKDYGDIISDGIILSFIRYW